MAIKHFLQFSDFSLDEYAYLIERTRIIKQKFKAYEPYHPLMDRTLVSDRFFTAIGRPRPSLSASIDSLEPCQPQPS